MKKKNKKRIACVLAAGLVAGLIKPVFFAHSEKNEDGTFNDESTTAVRTKYIDISGKKHIQVNVLTDNVYISACYLYNANKELVKVIEIPADKKRKFGVNLQELIAQIIEDEGGDQ